MLTIKAQITLTLSKKTKSIRGTARVLTSVFLQSLCSARHFFDHKCARDSMDAAILSNSTATNMLRMGKARHEVPCSVLALAFSLLALQHT